MSKKHKLMKIETRTAPANWGAFALMALVLVLLCAGGYFLSARGSGAETPPFSPVTFSEVMTANVSSVTDNYGYHSDWFELHNDSERPVSLNGWMVMRQTDDIEVFQFSSQTLGAGERVVVFCSGLGQNKPDMPLHAPFGLTASGETLVLMDASGAVMDSVTVPALQRNQVYALIDGAWTVTDEYTPYLPNTHEYYQQILASQDLSAVSGVEISEVMVKNKSAMKDKNGEYSDYIELHNATSRSMNLNGYMLSDDATAPDKFIFPDVTLPADGYLLVFASGEESLTGELHAAFKLTEGETVILSSPSGAALSQTTPQTDGPDQAWSLTKNGWSALYPPTPGYANDEYGVGAADQSVASSNTSHLHISEIMAKADAFEAGGGAYDWIEIYNDAEGTLDLSGWGLSDKSSHPRKWQFPQGASIEPGTYMVVYCTGLDTRQSGAYHTSFSLSSAGGYTVSLCDPDGNIVDKVAVPRQYADISYGRSYGVSGLRYFLEPTPGAANTAYGYTGRSEQATFSVKGGLYEAGETITLELTAAPGSTIYYTTDCTEPDATSTIYSHPITITDTTIVRARVYSTSEIPSFVTTETYFFGLDHTMRVVSLVTDPDNLWDENTGIYVMGPNATDTFPYGSLNQGANFWMDWEKAANVEVFTDDGQTLLSQPCGMKLQGQFSRAEDQKAFRLTARDEYGDEDSFEAALFTERDYTSYHSFLLRASGQDANKTRIRDVLQTSLADNTDVMVQASELCVVYLNGEYWGHYNMREHISKYSIAQWMGWDSDPRDIDIVKANRSTMQGSNATFEELLNWIKNEGGATAREKKNETLTQEDYDQILEHIASVVDVDNYLDYVIIQIYTGNTDLLNVKRYRSADEDGLWRWILFDMDWGFYYLDTNSMRRWLDPAGAGSGKKTDNTLFIELMKNPEIVDKFLRRFNELFVSTFNAEEVVSRMNALAIALEPEIDRHLEKWNISRAQYDAAWTELRRIVTNRPEYMMNYIQDTFDFTDQQMQDYFGESLHLIEVYKALHG